jgi:transposase
MLSPGPATKVYLAAGATDLRAGFERLSVLVQAMLEQNALSGHLFVFCNATRPRIKILYWDGTGLWLLTKQLEPGRYAWPAAAAQTAAPAPAPCRLTLAHSELMLLLSGIDLCTTRHRANRAQPHPCPRAGKS